MLNFYKAAHPLLFRIDPERAHDLTLKLLKTGIVPRCGAVNDPALKMTLWNLYFPNPVGLAAGFDKNAEIIGPMLNLGFGFVEAGTVTPKPQQGNPKPRLFRNVQSESIINRMGFPGDGLNRFKGNLEKFLDKKPRPAGIIGLNIGMNKDQKDPAKDYRALVRHLAPMADYLVINISSPNTPGLRDLQKPEALKKLLDTVIEERNKSGTSAPPPLLLKLAPDIDRPQQEEIAATIIECGVEGLILGNTTLDRPDFLPRDFANQKGGLSGPPVKDKSTNIIRNFYRLTNGTIPIIGLGGISSGPAAYEKIKAGASLVQLYTALVFKGPNVVKKINEELLRCLKQDGFNHISEAVGTGFGDIKENKTS